MQWTLLSVRILLLLPRGCEWLERGADLHMAQLMPLPLTVSCFREIQIGFTFLVPAHPGSPAKRAVECVCVSMSTGACCYWTGRHLT